MGKGGDPFFPSSTSQTLALQRARRTKYLSSNPHSKASITHPDLAHLEDRDDVLTDTRHEELMRMAGPEAGKEPDVASLSRLSLTLGASDLAPATSSSPPSSPDDPLPDEGLHTSLYLSALTAVGSPEYKPRAEHYNAVTSAARLSAAVGARTSVIGGGGKAPGSSRLKAR